MGQSSQVRWQRLGLAAFAHARRSPCACATQQALPGCMCRERGAGGRPQAELTCLEGQEAVWSDAVEGAVVAACGTPHFAAVGLQDGFVVVSWSWGWAPALWRQPAGSVWCDGRSKVWLWPTGKQRSADSVGWSAALLALAG